MKGSTPNGGYTIVEVLIFLAVSSALFISAMALLAGQQNKAQFYAAAKDIESRIQDALNDVSTGYYRNTGDFSCAVPGGPGGGPVITSPAVAGSAQGNNKDCISVGRIIQFSVKPPGGGPADPSSYSVYDVVGKRQYTVGGNVREVDDISEAKPIINPNTIDSQKLQAGMKVGKVTYTDGSGTKNDGAVGIFTSFGKTTSTGLQSGALSASLAPIDNFYGKSETSGIDGRLNSDVMAGLQFNLPTGITVCLSSGTTNQHVTITIGGQGRTLSATSKIEDNSCP